MQFKVQSEGDTPPIVTKVAVERHSLARCADLMSNIMTVLGDYPRGLLQVSLNGERFWIKTDLRLM